ncbi:MAG: hypothetical protein JW892_04305, partial [Anaerolineae bacterium]|nr:hypothetical protein [Anaerolineae bacterium]
NPAAPVGAGFYDTPGSAEDVAVSGGYAYVADQISGLRVVNVSNPAAPVEVGFCDTLRYAYGVAVSGDYAYVAIGDGGGGLGVVDVSNPAAPVEVGFYDTPGSAWGVAVSGDYAYVADGSMGLRVVDVSNPADPVEVGFYDTPDSAWRVAVSGGLAYVASVNGGLFILSYLPHHTFLPLVPVDYVRYFEGPWEFEPNNTYLQANGPLIPGQDYWGYPNDEKDYFSVYVRNSGTLTINLTDHTGAAVQVQLFYQGIDNRVAFDTESPYTITYNGQPGWYYVYIYTGGGYDSTTPYTLRVTYPQ